MAAKQGNDWRSPTLASFFDVVPALRASPAWLPDLRHALMSRLLYQNQLVAARMTLMLPGTHRVLVNHIADKCKRVLDEWLNEATHQYAERNKHEREVLRHRIRLIYPALTCEMFCALFVGLVIAAGFVGTIAGANFSLRIAGLFVLAMAAFIGGLTVLLREIFLAVVSSRDSMR